jgi:signal peptidase I
MRLNLFYSAGCLFRLGWVTLIIIAVLALVKQFVFDIMPVSGISMFPNFHDRDVIILNKLSYVSAPPQRGDNVVLRFPGDPDHDRYIKRLIGLPGEKVTIHDNTFFINDKPLSESYIAPDVPTEPPLEMTLKQDEYFLSGDNRPVSSDSRIWGPASHEDFIGKAFLIIFPAVPNPVY